MATTPCHSLEIGMSVLGVTPTSAATRRERFTGSAQREMGRECGERLTARPATQASHTGRGKGARPQRQSRPFQASRQPKRHVLDARDQPCG